jgi:hypothetical protein
MVGEVRSQYETEYAAITAVADKLGIGSAETLRTWVRREEAGASARGRTRLRQALISSSRSIALSVSKTRRPYATCSYSWRSPPSRTGYSDSARSHSANRRRMSAMPVAVAP